MDIKELEKLKLEYKEKINILNNPFGIEIEFSGAYFNMISEKILELFGYPSIEAVWNKKENRLEFDYQKWSLVNDATVQVYSKINRNQKMGGEIKSPIMTNSKKCWEELRQICNMLKQAENIEINGNCSIHIHTDKHIYTNIKEYINLLKLWMIYEDIIYKFSYGETNSPRTLLTRFAKPISYYIYENLEKLNSIETEYELLQFLNFERKNGINLRNIINDTIKQTIEIRTYNGTINEKIIQNEILFNQNLIEYAKIENFDQEYIDYKIKNYEPIFLNSSIIEHKEKAEELAHMIFKKELDILYFLKQYYKAYNEDDIEKTIHL